MVLIIRVLQDQGVVMHSEKLFKKKCLFSLTLALMLFSFNLSSAQLVSGFSDIQDISLASVRVSPFVQVGYQNLSVNLNLPFTETPVTQFGAVFYSPPALDLKFVGASVWVGTVGIEARPSRDIFLTLKTGGNVPANIRVITGENFHWFGISAPYDWNGSGLKWWDAECLLGYNLYKNWGVGLGLRYDHLTVNMKNPNGDTVTRPPWKSDYNQDVVTEAWIPSIALRLTEATYTAQVQYSPFATTQVTAPQSISSYIVNFANDGSLMNYKFNRTGNFMEIFFNYKLAGSGTLLFDFWAKGAWMWFHGSGDWSFMDNQSSVTPAIVSPQNIDGSWKTQALSAGLAATFQF